MNNEERTKEILARAEKLRKIHKRNVTIAGSIAGVLLFVCFQLFMFLPFSSPVRNVSVYADSEYYELIKKIEPITRSEEQYKNNWEKMISSFSFKSTKGTEYDASTSAAEATANYENTDLQTEGVTEGDRLKRTYKSAFYLTDQGFLNVYSMTEKSAMQESSLDLNTFGFYASWRDSEVYIGKDVNSVIVVAKSSGAGVYDGGSAVFFVDVTKLTTPRVTSRTNISGEVISSRMKDGKLFVMTRFTFGRDFDFNNEAFYVPRYIVDGEVTSFSPDDIIMPDDPTDREYVAGYEFTEDKVTSCIALLSAGSGLYASKDNIFVYDSGRMTAAGENEEPRTITNINMVSYTDGLVYKGKVAVDGTVNDRFSLDERNGVLRVVTTVSEGVGTPNASLYCVDLKTNKTVVELTKFAPVGETVRSVRFYDDKVYVCTALKSFENNKIYLTDPVFVIDLSDPDKITAKDTGNIPGYSLALKKFKGDTLVGLGYGEEGFLKVEMYRETETSVESITAYEDGKAIPATEYKTYIIDGAKSLIGVASYGERREYRILLFENDELKEFAKIDLSGLTDSQVNGVRAFIHRGNVYVFDDDGMQHFPLTEGFGIPLI